MREFDLEKAKAGAEVCTRSGKKARIICFDAKGLYPIIALIDDSADYEQIRKYTTKGEYNADRDRESDLDLVMAPVKKGGWINIYVDSFRPGRTCSTIFATKEEAESNAVKDEDYITTTRIEWEE